jgi:phytoene dehydrogenase-like protein
MSAAAFDVIVIGGGANGLVAASVLSKAGRRVLLIEQTETAGGQGRMLEFAPGFRAAPLGLDPGWLPRRIADGLGLTGLEPVATDTALSVAAAPGGYLTLSRDPSRAAAAIAVHSKSDAAKWGSFTTQLRHLAGFLEVLYQAEAPDIDLRTFSDVLPLLSLGRKFRALGRQNMIEFLRTVPLSSWELLDDWFECGPLKAAVAAGGIQDLQQGPRSGGTGFVLLHHLVGTEAGAVRGRIPWRAGPDAFTAVAEAAARRHGVTIRFGASVARILVRDEKASGVVLSSGEELAVKAVVSTAGPARTLLEWVDPVWLDPEFLRAVGNIRHRGCNAFVMYALESLPEFPGMSSREALAGVVSLTPDLVSLERAADAAKYGAIPDRPHVEVTVPTLLWPGLAPSGRHVAVARVQYAPYRLKDGQAWDDARREALADRVTSMIDEAAPGFRSRILHRAALSPADLEARFGLREGASSHGELALDQILFMRPVAGWGRHATPIAGLYLGGAGTHPGPGVLGGAGWLAAERLLERVRGSR